jgi:hypothetical protein
MERFEEAEAMLRGAYSVLHERLGDPHHRTQTCIRALLELCESTGRPGEGSRWRSKLRSRVASG